MKTIEFAAGLVGHRGTNQFGTPLYWMTIPRSRKEMASIFHALAKAAREAARPHRPHHRAYWSNRLLVTLAWLSQQVDEMDQIAADQITSEIAKGLCRPELLQWAENSIEVQNNPVYFGRNVQKITSFCKGHSIQVNWRLAGPAFTAELL